MKKLAQPTRSFFTLKISWKTSPGWLQLVFHFGTENRADQLKKTTLYLPCIFDWFHLFTQLWLTFWLSSCKQTIWKIWVETGKLQFSKIITHLNWSRSLINVVPIQTESCLNITTFVDIKNHVSEDFYVIGWTQWLFWFIVISCFFQAFWWNW